MQLGEIVFDCQHPAELARFWAAMLDDFHVRPYDEDEIARLASLGLTPETDLCVMVDGPGLKIGFQQAATASAEKNKVHLDLTAADRDTATALATSLGGAVVEVFDDHSWLRDPEGNDFCITDE